MTTSSGLGKSLMRSWKHVAATLFSGPLREVNVAAVVLGWSSSESIPRLDYFSSFINPSRLA